MEASARARVCSAQRAIGVTRSNPAIRRLVPQAHQVALRLSAAKLGPARFRNHPNARMTVPLPRSPISSPVSTRFSQGGSVSEQPAGAAAATSEDSNAAARERTGFEVLVSTLATQLIDQPFD